MINGAHVMIYTKDADADRLFFRDVLGFPAVDAGHGWMIFALPPTEAGFHPSDENGRHEVYLMCDDLTGVIEKLAGKGVTCTAPSDQGWGVVTSISLPGGGEIGLYQPRHPTALGLKAD